MTQSTGPRQQPPSSDGPGRLIPGPPGLTALVIYLWPVARASLLTRLARLGIFVIEQQEPARTVDIGIVWAGPQITRTRQVLEHIAPHCRATICVGDGEHAAGGREATFCVEPDTFLQDPGRALDEASRLARARRNGDS